MSALMIISIAVICITGPYLLFVIGYALFIVGYFIYEALPAKEEEKVVEEDYSEQYKEIQECYKIWEEMGYVRLNNGK